MVACINFSFIHEHARLRYIAPKVINCIYAVGSHLGSLPHTIVNRVLGVGILMGTYPTSLVDQVKGRRRSGE